MKSFNKQAMTAQVNANLKTAGLRQVADAIIEFDYDEHGRINFTKCQVLGYDYTGEKQTTKVSIYGLGVAKRHPNDPVDEVAGQRLAFRRAVSSFTARQKKLGIKVGPRVRLSKKRAEAPLEPIVLEQPTDAPSVPVVDFSAIDAAINGTTEQEDQVATSNFAL